MVPAPANLAPFLAAVPDAALPVGGPPGDRARGALLMATSALAFSGMSLFVKMASAELPAMEIVALRSVFMVAASLGFLRLARVSPFGVNRRLLVARGLVGAGALSLLYAGLTRLPLGEAVTLQNTAPVWTALFAALVLGERVRAGIVASVAASLVGVVLVAQPAALFGAAGLDAVGVALVMAAAVLMGLAYVAVRKLRETDHPLAIIFALSWAGLVLSVPFALGGGWRWPSPDGWALVLGVGLTTQVGQWTLTRGLYLLDAATATAVGYVQIVFAFAWGVLVFGDVPTGVQLLGAGIVVASVVALVAGRRAPAAARPSAAVPGEAPHAEARPTAARPARSQRTTTRRDASPAPVRSRTT